MSLSYLSAGLPLGLCNLLIRAGYGLALGATRGKTGDCCCHLLPLLLCACNNSFSTIIVTIVAIITQLSVYSAFILSMCVVLRSVENVADAQRWGQNGMRAKNHCDTG